MATKQRIVVKDGDTSSTAAYVVTGQNHLLQKRQFAFDGRKWFYQPDNRSKFQPVNAMDVPENVVNLMHAETGITVDVLRTQ
jgi:hypothetical protein